MNLALKKITAKIGEAAIFWLSFATTVRAQVPPAVDQGIEDARQAGGQEDVGLVEIVGNVIRTVLFLVGLLSVVMLIIGGIRYVVSAGNQDQVQGAKNTIIYALIGLIIAILAYAIVNFVVAQLGGDTESALLRLV